MKIRNFVKQDLPQVLELCREVRQHHIDILGGYFAEQDDFYEQQGFLESLEGNNMIALVAEDNAIICGYLLAERKSAPYLVNSKVINIANFGVAKARRKQGIGKLLMDKIFDICKKEGVDEIRLGVYNKNTDAYHFYENYGFKPLEQRINILLSKK